MSIPGILCFLLYRFLDGRLRSQVMPVVVWDDVDFVSKVSYSRIGVGPGSVTLALRGLLEDDMDPRCESGQHTEVPYGVLTGSYE